MNLRRATSGERLTLRPYEQSVVTGRRDARVVEPEHRRVLASVTDLGEGAREPDLVNRRRLAGRALQANVRVRLVVDEGYYGA